MERLSKELEEEALELAIKGDTYAKISKLLGFTTDMAFFRYREIYPDFNLALTRARAAACDGLEDQLLRCAESHDPKAARVKMESIAKILAYRNPQKYGNRVDLNVTQTIDIVGSIERAERRVKEINKTDLVALAASKLDEIL